VSASQAFSMNFGRVNNAFYGLYICMFVYAARMHASRFHMYSHALQR
jgi:hypothetical protein